MIHEPLSKTAEMLYQWLNSLKYNFSIKIINNDMDIVLQNPNKKKIFEFENHWILMWSLTRSNRFFFLLLLLSKNILDFFFMKNIKK